MTATLRYVLITAARDRLFLAVFLVSLLAVGVSAFLGDTALTEKRAAAAVFAGAAVRMVIIVGLVVFIAFHVQRLDETAELETILSRPISREGFVLAYWGGLALLGLALTLPLGLVIAFMAPDRAGGFLWGVSLMLESLLVVAIATFCSLTLKRATAATLAAMAFYTLGRLIGLFLAIAERQVMTRDFGEARRAARFTIEAVAAVSPRLDLFGQSVWLVHGPGEEAGLGLLVVQVLAFGALLLAATMVDLRRRRGRS